MKVKSRTKLQLTQEKAQDAINKTNKTIEKLGENTSGLYESLTRIQELFDKIRKIPSDKKLEYQVLKKIILNWKQQVEKFEKDYQETAIKNTESRATRTGIGVAVLTMRPTVAMGFTTTFGLASTSTAISTISSTVVTNVALASFGGGTLVASGGMATAQSFLTLAGPIGWAITGVSLVLSGLLFWRSKSDKKRLEEVFIAINRRDVKSYELAIVELKERIIRIVDEREKLNEAIENIQTFGLDYNMMTEEQQYELGAYVNLMLSSTQLLINPIQGLLPKCTMKDFDDFISWNKKDSKNSVYVESKDFIVTFANLLYKVELDNRDKKLLWKSFRKNKKMLKLMEISKKEFDMDIMNVIFEVLKYKYKTTD